MKQLEVVNFASLTEKSSKTQHRAVSQLQKKTYGSETCNWLSPRDVLFSQRASFKFS